MLRRLLPLLLLLLSYDAVAHDARPAYLEVRQTSPTRYDLLWRIPVTAGMPPPVLR